MLWIETNKKVFRGQVLITFLSLSCCTEGQTPSWCLNMAGPLQLTHWFCPQWLVASVVMETLNEHQPCVSSNHNQLGRGQRSVMPPPLPVQKVVFTEGMGGFCKGSARGASWIKVRLSRGGHQNKMLLIKTKWKENKGNSSLKNRMSSRWATVTSSRGWWCYGVSKESNLQLSGS